MTKDEALSFLRQHQPMPSDEYLTRELIGKYDEVRKYFLQSPDKECIPLFLNSFGNGSGFGVYQVVEDVMWKFQKEDVIPHLIKGLSSEHRGVRSWNAEIAANFPDPQLIPWLHKILLEDDIDIRYASIIALGQIDDKRVYAILKEALGREKEEDLKRLLRDVLAKESKTP